MVVEKMLYSAPMKKNFNSILAAIRPQFARK